MNIPNIITLVRIILVPVIVWLMISGEMLFALAVFIFAGITDGADGYIAKKFDQKTELGAYLDAIADKLLLVSIYVVLGMIDELPPWLVILVVSRDVLIVGAIILSWLIDRPVQVRPLMISKINTVAQIVLASLVLTHLGLDIINNEWIMVGTIVVGILTIGSATAYVLAWMAEMARHERQEEQGLGD